MDKLKQNKEEEIPKQMETKIISKEKEQTAKKLKNGNGAPVDMMI